MWDALLWMDAGIAVWHGDNIDQDIGIWVQGREASQPK